MQEEQNQNSKKDFSNPNDKPSPDNPVGKDTPSEHPKTEDQKENTTDIKKEPYNIIINIPEKKDKSANTANIISIINVLVAAILAVVTYLLFQQATRDSKTAERAANAAQDAVTEQRLNDSTIRKNDSMKFILDTASTSKNFREDSISNRRNFEISANTLKAQTNALTQQQKDFEIENRPVLGISDFSVDTTYPDNKINISLVVNNYGKFPAKDIYVNTKINIGVDTLSLLNRETQYITINTNDYIANGGRLNSTTTTQIINSIVVRIIKNKETNIFVFINMHYQSNILNKTYFSYLVYKISFTPSFGAVAIVNKEWEN